MTEGAWIGANVGRVGTSAAGRRILEAGLAYQAANPEKIRNPVVLKPTERLAAVVLVSPLGDRVSLPGKCREIIEEVAAKYGVRPAAIVSPIRKKKIMPSRFEAIFRCVSETDFSLAEIGRVFHRDHTTIGASVMRHCRTNNVTPPRGMNWVASSPEKRKRQEKQRQEQRARTNVEAA